METSSIDELAAATPDSRLPHQLGHFLGDGSLQRVFLAGFVAIFGRFERLRGRGRVSDANASAGRTSAR